MTVYVVGSGIYPTVTVSVSTYTVLTSNFGSLIRSTYSTTGTQTVTLPTALNDGFYCYLVDSAGSAGTNNITINCNVADTFSRGGTSYVLNTNFGNARLVYSAPNNKWDVLL